MKISIEISTEEILDMFGVNQINSKNLPDIEREMSSKTGFNCTLISCDLGSGACFFKTANLQFDCYKDHKA